MTWHRPSFSALALVVALQLPSFHADTRLVVLHVTVRNTRGELVTDLDRGAFAVYENGKRQPITIFRRDDIPVSVGLLIDNSGSMRSIRSAVEAAALAFAEASNPLDELFVINFADTPRLDVPLTSDRGLLERGIARVDAIGGTAMRDAVNEAEVYVGEHGTRDRRALLLITDGNDNASTVSLAQITQWAQQHDVVIYAVGLFGTGDTSGSAHRALDHLAERSGGAAAYPSSITDVNTVVREMAEQIRKQYTLAYTSLNQALDGGYRNIRVTVAGREHYVTRTRSGYRAIP